MKRGTTGHWKILNLAMELKVEPYAAVGICCCMWEWVGNSLMTGNIGKADDAMIAHQIGWTKKPSILIDALVKVGLLDLHPEHRLVVHDWSEHADDGVHTWLVRRRLWFADGKPPRTRHLHSNERVDAERFYGSSTTPPQSKCGENVAGPPDGHNAKAVGTVRIGTDTDKSPQPPADAGGVGAKRRKAKRTDRQRFLACPEFPPGFEAFWRVYPEAGQKDKAVAAWEWHKAKLEPIAEAIAATVEQWTMWWTKHAIRPPKAGEWLKAGNYHESKEVD